MGAWIEIYGIDLKSTLLIVAPLVGAWIEIYNICLSDHDGLVAPLVGAWIEILDGISLSISLCRSSRGSVD